MTNPPRTEAQLRADKACGAWEQAADFATDNALTELGVRGPDGKLTDVTITDHKILEAALVDATNTAIRLFASNMRKADLNLTDFYEHLHLEGWGYSND